ncbi:protein-glutamine gamma-glutamyltransferase [Cohnella silvisoli]|uniref:Protein-glutamine gamma-glutamyltransferase n=1 Tax=Cohnella silvisoli TaxID=2873699 RepID=A0ABV1KNR1_9BACL|nr:protein-glutamine gamma-glutamyltransferase [Cohnella silvisoli]MCD9020235.1 protein-glutamine gamma-glutamyltransferase [Cohnella silvisoli]
MILISNGDAEQISKLPLSQFEKDIVQNKWKSSVVYQYDSLDALEFELTMRTSIVKSANALNSSAVTFDTFENSRCNERLWSRTDNGGFQLRSGVLPSDGISDIFQNGRYYAFECSTAIVIVLYKAILDVIHKETFNNYFKDLYLRDWNSDSDLRLISTYNNQEAYPGDVLYFKNPDHDPEKPEWQGENTFKLADDLYYGHGIGRATSEKMISSLNEIRIPGSTTSAYLSELVMHPDFEHLRKLSPRESRLVVQNKHIENPIVASIGTKTYIL